MTFQQDTEKTIVLFRRERRKDGEVTAVFPEIPANDSGNLMTCFAHVGQHGACDLGWYYSTRPATPAEYADLKRELESAPYGYNLDIRQRITRKMFDQRKAEVGA